MLSKEEIEKAKEKCKNIVDLKNSFLEETSALKATETLLQYIDQLEQENNKLNKMIDEMLDLLGSLKLSKDIEGYEIMEKEDWRQYFEEKVEEK